MERSLSQTDTPRLVRIAVIGPESTGKTTLSRALAAHFQTAWVPEYMREYCQKLWDESRQVCRWQDIMPIAIGQMQSENRLAAAADNLLFCDTCLLELVVYSYLYYGKCLPEIEAAALSHRYGIIFLTDIDVPWVADDLRDKPQERETVFALFCDFLNRHGIAFTLLRGSHQTRMQTAVAALQTVQN